ncbi:MAG: VOC family protein [Pseudomonadales bacterium]
MAKAVGIGGTFMKATDPEKLARWYQEALGLGEIGPSNTGSFGVPLDPKALPTNAYVQWSVMPEQTKHYPGTFMFNFVVDDIKGVVERVDKAGGEILREDFFLEGVGTFRLVQRP